ncbi:MAG: bifunctional demethylmenaquinone methyltransferase/2-methoxy-6-polyprenyl-1,4-benzoquinol methylase UbiE [Gammaproteobacteria bacterium]|uniref:Ubiquinone/menaquinone biosynthesis C-methyltransferase UbiE n=1 Tax=SAR86 cluster bacterium TaxID=2030880 RepID=A0A368C7G9_9GAMM|nr:MAG: bifunctional demethylmenaquinone methyltransferase/2-methoxy-6-polyprenyl-1,4-benzoquinol methylase UbiE [SAR86 cluster bacterium]RPG41475.1 MAG: bifunctional demethylmenaquinone methyltransferase/2-methoxy-6-polyprenyl-1,4-benzoquinol methylase UbiE [Gammaproteobacteria bacterium TMED186]|tara:strand:+ start:857 stop:1594 length:738 start_codon:yes stop_codon:yes gene_type:complete
MNKKTHFGYKEINVDEKAKQVGGVFTSVANSYDVMNDAMSIGLHRLWKRILVEIAGIKNNDVVLDIAAGTGDIAKLISKQFPSSEIYVSDINNEMLSLGRERSIDEGFSNNTHFCQLSGEAIPFNDATFDVITIGFGLRNFTDKSAGLKEMRRCLKKNGRLLILEFSKPNNLLFSKVYDWYSFNILPKLGALLASDSDSYQYLAESIRMHPDQENLKKLIIENGFEDCKFYNLLNGIVAIHVGYK